jgi:dTDP-4-amino-4,6-dideoxygalactose transaminase
LIKPWLVRRALQHQLANLRRLAAGEPLRVAPLGGMTLDPDDVRIARDCLRERQGWFELEPVVRFQEDFACWNGSRHAFAFMGGRVALSGCLHALGLGAGDEVIVPGYTCVVVPNALKFAGVTPVYCDIELDTYGPDIASVEAAITPRTRAILLHHLYGLVCRDYDDLLDLARRRGLPIIEDCAHATGAEHRGTRVGNAGTLAFYSSEQTKVFSTIQGGVAVTNDDSLAARLRDFWERCPDPTEQRVEALLRNLIIQYYSYKHPQNWWLGDVMEIAHGAPELISTTPDEMRGQRPAEYGCRMAAPVARLGANQIRKLDAYNERRRETARRWDQWCRDNGYQPARVMPESKPVYLRYPVMVEPERKRDVSWGRRELGVDVGVWFRGSIHPLDGSLPGLPNAAAAVASCVNLPCLIP